MRCMKKWQKITGIIALVVLAIINVTVCMFYFDYAASIYFEPGGKTQNAIELMRTFSQHAIKGVSVLVCANYIIALCLFTCLWRKGGRR